MTGPQDNRRRPKRSQDTNKRKALPHAAHDRTDSPPPGRGQLRFHNGTSLFERHVRQELGSFYRSEERAAKRRIQSEGGHTDAVDVLLADIGVVIEYDGSYYHRGSARARNDATKAERLRRLGWTVIRIREQPLERLDDSDVLVEARASVHTVVVAVLEQIERLRKTQVGGLADYRAAGQPCTPRPSKERGEDDAGLATAELLDAISGPGWRKFQDKLLNLSTATVLARAAFLEDVFGARWRDYPSLLGCTPESLQTKIERFDRDYGLIWRKKPSLLGRNPAAPAKLTAAEARAHDGLPAVGALVDFIVTTEPTIRASVYGSTSPP